MTPTRWRLTRFDNADVRTHLGDDLSGYDVYHSLRAPQYVPTGIDAISDLAISDFALAGYAIAGFVIAGFATDDLVTAVLAIAKLATTDLAIARLVYTFRRGL